VLHVTDFFWGFGEKPDAQTDDNFRGFGDNIVVSIAGRLIGRFERKERLEMRLFEREKIGG
jgi:hypothetical protein